jgi:hypothetical protein
MESGTALRHVLRDASAAFEHVMERRIFGFGGLRVWMSGYSVGYCSIEV